MVYNWSVPRFRSFVVGVAKLGLRRQVVALEIEGSNPSAHPYALHPAITPLLTESE